MVPNITVEYVTNHHLLHPGRQAGVGAGDEAAVRAPAQARVERGDHEDAAGGHPGPAAGSQQVPGRSLLHLPFLPQAFPNLEKVIVLDADIELRLVDIELILLE